MSIGLGQGVEELVLVLALSMLVVPNRLEASGVAVTGGLLFQA